MFNIFKELNLISLSSIYVFVLVSFWTLHYALKKDTKEECSVLNWMFRFLKLTGSVRIRRPTMPCVLGCWCFDFQRSLLNICSVFVKSCSIVAIKH